MTKLEVLQKIKESGIKFYVDQEDGMIRTKEYRTKGKADCCPLNALYQKETGLVVTNLSLWAWQDYFNLTKKDVHILVSSADDTALDAHDGESLKATALHRGLMLEMFNFEAQECEEDEGDV